MKRCLFKRCMSMFWLFAIISMCLVKRPTVMILHRYLRDTSLTGTMLTKFLIIPFSSYTLLAGRGIGV